MSETVWTEVQESLLPKAVEAGTSKTCHQNKKWHVCAGKVPAKAASNKLDKGPVNVLTPSVPDA